MKRIITLLSVLAMAFGGVAYGATAPAVQQDKENVQITKSEDQTKVSQDVQWEKAHAYAHFRSETR
ncbi:MAG: hypothetical protein Q4B33_06665 [Fusobacterium sp.]|nr:hypothetical protein [Fusobacterium sp.]